LTDLRWQGRINFPNKFLLMKQILGGGVLGKNFFFILKRGRRRSSCLLFCVAGALHIHLLEGLWRVLAGSLTLLDCVKTAALCT
jgi:hypothetical protein